MFTQKITHPCRSLCSTQIDVTALQDFLEVAKNLTLENGSELKVMFQNISQSQKKVIVKQLPFLICRLYFMIICLKIYGRILFLKKLSKY